MWPHDRPHRLDSDACFHELTVPTKLRKGLYNQSVGKHLDRQCQARQIIGLKKGHSALCFGLGPMSSLFSNEVEQKGLQGRTYHKRSTRPPCLAMADFTRLANCTASSLGYGRTEMVGIHRKGLFGMSDAHLSPTCSRSDLLTCLVIGGRYQTLQTMAQLVIILSR